MTTYKRQTEKVSKYLAFDLCSPSNVCVKSEKITEEHEFYVDICFKPWNKGYISSKSKIIANISNYFRITLKKLINSQV